MEAISELVTINWGAVNGGRETGDKIEAPEEVITPEEVQARCSKNLAHIIEQLQELLLEVPRLSFITTVLQADAEEVENPKDADWPEWRYTGKHAITIIYAKEVEHDS